LEAIYLGHSYVARNGFSGQFEFGSLGFEGGRLPVYVPEGTEAALHVKISGVSGGTVHVISRGEEIANATQLASTAEFEQTFTFSFGGETTYFRVVVTNSTGSPFIISNPIFFVHKPMLPGSYIYISDPAASVQSWNFTEFFTHREVSMRLVAGDLRFPVSRNGTAIYIRLPTREAGYQIKIANLTRPADEFYNDELAEYVVPLGDGLPVDVALLLDRSVLQAIIEVAQWSMLLLALVIIPFIAAGTYLAVEKWAKGRRTGRR
jgi:hypothetical protein